MSDDDNYDYESSIPYYEYLSMEPAGENTVSTLADQGEITAPLATETRRPHHKLLYSIIGILSAVLVIAAGSAALFLYLRPSSPRVPRLNVNLTPRATSEPTASQFRYSACPFQPGNGIIEGQQVRCGVLLIPEDRSHPHGMTLQLAVAIFKSLRVNASPVPELYLEGGPGGGALADLGTYITLDNLDKMTLGHDLILLDQRGTGYSKPALNCPEFYNSQGSAALEGQRCHDRLTASGINLTRYTTIDNATDVHDLIHALGYRQVNLYGVSYGTRLALTMMRLFPGDIRSVVLDSTVPTQENLFKNEPVVLQHAFDVLFHGCTMNFHCNAAYPQLESIFYSLVTTLNAHPVIFQDAQNNHTVSLDGDELVSWLFSAMYVTELIPQLPEAIMQIRNGNYDLISQYFAKLLDRGISDGMYYSVECGEDMAFTTKQDLMQAANVLRPEIRPGILAGLQDDFAICQAWGQKPVPASQKQPVTSSLPTLILSGEYDPITPSSNAELAMQTLSRSFLFVFPATGHGVFSTNNCPDSIMSAFMQNPSVKPDASCIAAMTEPAFQ